MVTSNLPTSNTDPYRHVPEDLKNLDQWGFWRWGDPKPDGSGLKKDLRQIRAPSEKAKSNDLSTWAPFNDVYDATRKGADGIWFCIEERNGLVGFDFDDCFDKHGHLRDWAKPYVEALDPVSYGEYSPSRHPETGMQTGLKFLTYASKPVPGKSTKKQVYDPPNGQEIEVVNNKFWCITGEVYPGATDIRDGQHVVDWICQQLWPDRLQFVQPVQPVDIGGGTSNGKPAGNDGGNLSGFNANDNQPYAAHECPVSDVEKAREALKHIGGSIHDYDDWVRIGTACYHTDPSLLQDWIAVSRKSGKFEEGECEKKWATFARNGGKTNNVATLIKIAQIDDPNWKPSWAKPDVYSIDFSPVDPTKPADPDDWGNFVLFGPAFKRSLEKIQNCEGEELMPTGVDGFELCLGKVVTLCAPPGKGKTTLANQMGFEVIANDPSLTLVIANAETDPEVLAAREISRRSGISYTKIRHGDCDPGEQILCEKAYKEIEPILDRIRVMEEPFRLEKFQNLIGKPPGIIIVDFLQEFAPPKLDALKGLGAVMTTFRSLARAGWAVFGLSSTARGEFAHDDSKLGLGSFRGSADIEFKSDACYVLREDYNDTKQGLPQRKMYLDCLKNRNGDQHRIELIFDRPNMSFLFQSLGNIKVGNGGKSKAQLADEQTAKAVLAVKEIYEADASPKTMTQIRDTCGVTGKGLKEAVAQLVKQMIMTSQKMKAGNNQLTDHYDFNMNAYEASYKNG